jgi:PPM family protein phosphatase
MATGDEERRVPAGPALTWASGTQVGKRYRDNFDVLHVDPVAGLAVVADGMGAGRGSTAAGRTAVDTFVDGIRTAGRPVHPRTLRSVVATIQRQVLAAGSALGELTGCTLTALLLDDADGPADSAWLVQLGDSRAYRLRGDLLELLTVDHTVAWLGALYGWFPADSVAAVSARYQLTRYVGHPDAPEPDVLNVGLRPGDVYCLCTDGLAEELSYEHLAERLGSRAAPADIVAGLLADALAAGGNDNATVVVLRVGEPAEPAS